MGKKKQKAKGSARTRAVASEISDKEAIKSYIIKLACRCGKDLVVFPGLAEWCSGYGNSIPWLTNEDLENGITYESKYPDGCGFKLMVG